MRKLGLTDDDLRRLPKGDSRKCALAELAHSRTMVSHTWLAERLNMGHPQNLTRYIKLARSFRIP